MFRIAKKWGRVNRRPVSRPKIRVMLCATFAFLVSSMAARAELPDGFVYLSDIDPSIVQDIRYYSSHNFTGRRVDGYHAPECILTKQAAMALSKVQEALRDEKLSLIVWDCYRPARAVADFSRWSNSVSQKGMKAEFFPNTEKASLFALGYLAGHSAHSRGSAVDLGLVPKDYAPATFDPAASAVACTALKGQRFEDGTVDLGTGYDCLDPRASIANTAVTAEAQKNRARLRKAMMDAGFKPYSKEWWHFELTNEPFPGREFNFTVEPKGR